jgi:hypothetical protein
VTTVRLRETWRSLRFFQLFAFTVLALLLIPLQQRYHALWLVLSALYLNALLVSLMAGGYRPRLRWAFFAGWALTIVLKEAPVAEPGTAALLYVASRVLVLILLGGCVVAALRYILLSTEVSVDRIFAGIVAYMLVALGFAAAYAATATLAPGSFAWPAETLGAEPPDREVQLIYFSFVTIATLGYGDITPRLPFAQMLAVLEAVVGQFYVAVIIAWLVSAHVSHRRPPA